MAQNIQLPDGTFFPMKEGETPEQALMAAASRYPEAFKPREEKPKQDTTGLKAAAAAGFESLKGETALTAGKAGIMDTAAAEAYYKAQQEAAKKRFTPTQEGWTEAPWQKFKETLGGSLPYMAAPAAAGLAALAAPVSAPVAAALGLGAAGVLNLGQFTGTNLARQMDTGKSLEETSGAAAFGTAIPQALMDTAAMALVPGIGKLFNSVGSKLTTEQARAIANQTLGKTIADYTAKTGMAMGREGVTETTQQLLERLQAGLSITDPEARKEYVDSFIGGAVLAGAVSPAGRYIERSGARKQAEDADAQDKAAAKAAAAQAKTAADAAEEARKQTPEYMRQAVAESAALEKQKRDLQAQIIRAPKGETLTEEQKQANVVINAQLKELAPKLTEAAKESNRVKPLLAKAAEEARLAGMSPEEFMLEQTFRSPGMQVPKGGRFETVPEKEVAPAPEPTAVERYAAQQTEAAQEAGALTLSDITEYLLRDPVMAAEIVRMRIPIPGLPEQTNDAVIDALALQLKAQARQEMAVRDAQLRSQLPAKPAVGKRKAPDYNAYLDALDKLDFDRREGVTESDIRELESLRRQTAVTDQGELFGAPTGQRTVLGNAPKTRQEYLADLRIARATNDRKAAEAAIANLRKLDDEAESQKKFQTGAAPEFRLTGEQRQRLFESGYTEAQIDEAESRAQKSAGQVLGAGQTPMSVAIQQLASDNRAEAFAKIVDLVSRYNRGAAKQEDLNAARDRLVSGLITDIQQSRGKPLTDSERQDVTRDANTLLRELIERFGDTRNLTQKGEDNIVSAQTRTGEFTTNEVPGMGFPTIESRAPGQQTFGSPLAAAQSIREGLEELRSRAITGDTTSFSREYTPSRISAEAVQTQLERELAKNPKSHSTEQRRTLEAIGDNLRMMLRPESREDVSAWLYDLARDAGNVSPELTRSVNDTLAAVEKAKRSETELETREFVSGTGTRVNTAQQPDLPLGPGRELQRTELAGPQRAAPVAEGAYSQISTAPSQEETQSTVFSNYAQLQKFLASDALQQVRSALGLGRPTLARLNARLQPFVAKIKAAQAKAKELSIQAQKLEQRKRNELKELNIMTAADAAAETLALNQAKQVLEENKRRLAELKAPLQKELAPFIKEFVKAQKQFEKAVAAQEETFVVMLRNRDVFQARELAAIEKVYRIQDRMKRARSKILGAFEKDFGEDPRNLSRMMREFKETGKQVEFNEQLAKAHEELNKVFFATRKDDTAIKQFLNQSVKFELQLQAQAATIDAMALKLLDAGMALQVVSDTQLDLAENKDAILAVKGKTQEASRTLTALEDKQQDRLNAVKQLEDSLGLSRQTINHRFSEDVTVAEVLRASTDAEKDLVGRLDALMGVLNENVPAVKALRAFKRSRDAAILKRPETPAQKQSRDVQREKLVAAIGRDPASFEGERISFEKRTKLLEELKASGEARTELEALIAATDEAIPLMQGRIAEAEKELKRLNAEIAALKALGKKKPKGFQAQLEQKSALVSLPYLIAARDKFARVPQQMAEDIAAYKRDKATAQSNLTTLEEREAELGVLFSNDPEVQKVRTEAIDARIAKVEDNLKNNIEGLKEKNLKKTTRESRERAVRKYKKELQRLQAQRSAKFGIARRGLPTLAPVTQAVEAGERLEARKVGPLVAPTRTAGNIRTGDIETTGERKLSPRAPISQSGKPKDLPAIAPVAEADTVEDRILGEMDALEKVRMTVEDRLVDAVADGNTEETARLRGVRDRIDGQMAEKQAELKTAQEQAELKAAQAQEAAPAEEAVAEEVVAKEAAPAEEISIEEEVNTEPTIDMVVGPEAAKVVKAEVAKLAPAEVTTLEETYGAKKNSKKFLAQLSADIVDMVNNGGKAVAKGIRAIVNKIASGVLAVGVVFSPQYSQNFSFDLPKAYSQTITQTAEIKEQVPAEAIAKMSPMAKMVYENMAPTAKASGKGFIIADKPNAMMHFFLPDGRLLVQDVALFGKDAGDVLSGTSSLLGGKKITPAGQFSLAVADTKEYAGGKVLNLVESRDETGFVAVHAAYLGNPAEKRAERLQALRAGKASADISKISYGCAQTLHDTFLGKITPNIDLFNGGMIFVLPDAQQNTAAMFPASYKTPTQTFTGYEKTASTENVKRLLLGKEEKLNVDSLKSLYRTSKSTGTALKLDTIRGLVDRVTNGFANVPQIEVIESESQLPDYIRAQAKSDNVQGSIPGLFDPNTNKVYLVASNLFTPADVFTTIAHEVTGHFGLRSLLGSGYANEMGRIYNGNRDVKAKADAKMRETPSLNKNTATEEVLADMAEQDPNAKGPGVLRAVYNALRGLIRRAFGQTVSDKDVQQLVANARRHVIKGGVNRVTETGTAAPLYSIKKPQFESENALTELSKKIIAQPKSFKERMGSNLALEAEMNAVDMRAGLQEALKRGAKDMGNEDLFTQAMYNVRKADQYMPLVYTALTTGPLESYTDEKGLRGLRSSNKDSAVDVIAAAKNVPAKNAEGKFSLATTYMLAQRAANKGLSKLDLGELGLTEADLAAAMSAANADPALKSSLEEVRRRYNAYNEGQIKFLAEMGAITKADAKAWLKDGDYVPYYRVRDDGTAELVFGGEKTLTIGDIRTQPYLAELKGGDTKILPLNESIIRNTMLITKAGLYNNATKEVAYAMQEFGEGKGPDGKNAMPIKRGHGPAGSDIIRFKQEPDPKDPKDDGQRWLRIDTKNTAMEGIPSELVVKSLEGAHLTLPAFLKIGGIAGDWLRKGVTRMPPYIFRQLIRDPMAASFTGGLNYGPFRAVVMAGVDFLRSSAGRSETSKKLIEKGLIQSGVFSGDPDDMSTFATQLASGKDGAVIDRLFGMLDRAAIRADAATRGLVYENARKNGLSEVEADMMTMESMNFYKRGLSPMVQYGNRLIPFMNSQIQGLNVLGKAMRGNMPFEDRQRIQRKFWNNAVVLFGVGLVYAMAMEDDDTFKNAKPRDKYTNFFVHLPGVSEAVKIPLPYEAGWFFSAAVALADAMKAETNGDQQLQALREMFLSSVPGYSSKFMPQAIKPLWEIYTNKNFFSGQNIESISMQNRSPEERFNASTTEAAKALAKVLPLSPVQIEHIARGYFGTAPLAMMSVASGFMREDSKGAAPERRLSEMPIVGTVFQKKYGGADADTMYAFAKEATQRAASLKDIQKNGTPQEYKEYLANHRTEIMLAPMARNFEMLLGRLRTQEDVVRNRKDLNEGEKRVRLDQLDKVRQDLANKFNAAVRKVEAARAS